MPETRKFLVAAAVVFLAVLSVIAGAVFDCTAMPGRSYQGLLPPLDTADSQLQERLRAHVAALTAIGPRCHQVPGSMAKTVAYIGERMKRCGGKVEFLPFTYDGEVFTNIELTYAGSSEAHRGEIVVVGAHYDLVSHTV